MDTSKEYIAMCDCEEVQGQWGKKDNEYSISYENNDIWISHEGNFTYKAEAWLPRQDQIQEMLDIGDLKKLLHDYTFFVCSYCKDQFNLEFGKWVVYISQFETLEQLWLAYYMHEKHSKRWVDPLWKSE